MKNKKKYHISKKGTPVECKAKIKCRMGGDEVHYDTLVECEQAIQKKFLEDYSILGSPLDNTYLIDKRTNKTLFSEVVKVTDTEIYTIKDSFGIRNNKKVPEVLNKEEYIVANRDELESYYTNLNNAIASEIETWSTVSESPYSKSYYNYEGVDWGYKQEGSLRMSDHWNFESRGDIHCKTDCDITTGWAVGKYSNGVYKIIKRYNEKTLAFEDC